MLRPKKCEEKTLEREKMSLLLGEVKILYKIHKHGIYIS